MAQQQQGVVLDEDQLCCPICLELLREAVTIACGHSYCSSCIGECWDKADRGAYSCPQCRQSFWPRPALKKNTMLAEVVEQLRRTSSASAALTYAGPGDVACDLCTGPRRHKALVSCLACLVSFCEVHLQPHRTVPGLKKHKLVKATVRLQEQMCPSHDKLLEVYCRTDRQCVCYLCAMEEHKGHDTVSAAAERTEKQKQLTESQFKVQQRVQEKEEELKELRQAVEALKSAARTAEGDCDGVFFELSCSVERRHKEAKDLIRAQEEAAVGQAEGLLEGLEQELEELRRREEALGELSQTDDHVHFIQSFQSTQSCPSTSSPRVPLDLLSLTVPPLRYFKIVSDAVPELRDKLESILEEMWPKMSANETADGEPVQSPAESPGERGGAEGAQTGTEVTSTSLDRQHKGAVQREHPTRFQPRLPPRLQPRLPPRLQPCLPPRFYRRSLETRADFLQYACPLSLDPNTISNGLVLSAGNRKVTGRQIMQAHPGHPERFTCWYQVLCREGQSARCYWEVEWRGALAYLAVFYKDIPRTGKESRFGHNDKSWSLRWTSNGSCFIHNNVETAVLGLWTLRLGMYLDHKAGTLSFYSVSGDTMTLVHTVQTTFTQALYPGIRVFCKGGTAELCNIW